MGQGCGKPTKQSANGNNNKVAVEYSTLGAADVDAAVELASRVMGAGEPVFRDVLAAKGFDEAKRIAAIHDGCFSLMKEGLVASGLSTVAKVGDQVVGVRFTLDWKDAPGPPPMPAELEEYHKMWVERDNAWMESKGGLDAISKGEYAHWVGLAVDSDFGQRGIATELYRRNAELLQEKGYKGAVAETASAFSQKAAQKNGFTKFSSTEYATYKTEAGELFFEAVQLPHQFFTVWECSIGQAKGDANVVAEGSEQLTVQYLTLGASDVDAAVELASRVMGAGEPVFRDVLAVKGFDEAKRIAAIHDGCFGLMKEGLVASGLSTVAKVNDQVVGVRFTLDWKDAPGPPPMPAELEEYRKMWVEQDNAWMESKGGLDAMSKGEYAHWVGLAVDSNFGQRGIATELYRRNVELLREKGYKGAVAETASAFSQKAAEKNGFQRFSTTEYSTYKTEAGEHFFEAVQAPHEFFTLWECSL